MGRRAATCAAAVAVAAALAACNEDRGSAPSSGRPEATHVSGTGYDATLPEGWIDRTAKARERGGRDADAGPIRLDAFWQPPDAAVTFGGGFRTGVLVERAVDMGVFRLSLRWHARVVRGGFRGRIGPGTAVSPMRESRVGARRAREMTFTARAGQLGRLRVRALVVRYRNDVYTISLAAPRSAFAQLMPQFREILASWRWK